MDDLFAAEDLLDVVLPQLERKPRHFPTRINALATSNEYEFREEFHIEI